MFQALILQETLFLNKFLNFSKLFSPSYYVLRYNLAFTALKHNILQCVMTPVGDEKSRSGCPKPRECCNFEFISVKFQETSLTISGSEIGHPKAPWGPPFMLPWRPPGDLFFICENLCCFDASRATLEPSWCSPGRLRTLLAAPLGALLGASWGPLRIFFETPQGPHDDIAFKKLSNFAWSSRPYLLYFLL